MEENFKKENESELNSIEKQLIDLSQLINGKTNTIMGQLNKILFMPNHEEEQLNNSEKESEPIDHVSKMYYIISHLDKQNQKLQEIINHIKQII